MELIKILHKVVTMCYVVCDRCKNSSSAEHTKKDAVWVAKKYGWKLIKGEVVCDECQKKMKEEKVEKTQEKTKRLNHRKLHRELEAVGYNVYVLDYSEGAHHYQIEKSDPHEWHEYSVKTTNEGRFIDLSGVGKELYEHIMKYYEVQGATVR